MIKPKRAPRLRKTKGRQAKEARPVTRKPTTLPPQVPHFLPTSRGKNPGQGWIRRWSGHLRKCTSPTTTKAAAEASALDVQDAPEEQLEEILGHPEKPKCIPGNINFMARQDREGDWSVFEAEVDAPIGEDIDRSLKHLRDQIQVSCRSVILRET